MAHKYPKCLKKLIYALDDIRFDIFVHVDKKCNLKDFYFDEYQLQYSKLYILRERKNVLWADISQVDAMVALYKAAMRKGAYIRFVMLSGQDYPIRSNDEIYDVLSDTTKEFIMGNPIEEKERFKIEKFHFWKLQKYPRISWRVNWILGLLNIRKQTREEFESAKGVKIYFAPQWHALSYECVKYVLRYYRKYYGYFKYAFASDELLIPTVVFNSPYGDHSLQKAFPLNAHYNDKPAIHYIDYGAVVRVFHKNDFEELINSSKLFFRKIEPDVSDTLIASLEEFRVKK